MGILLLIQSPFAAACFTDTESAAQLIRMQCIQHVHGIAKGLC
jgi:hypothetical protein